MRRYKRSNIQFNHLQDLKKSGIPKGFSLKNGVYSAKRKEAIELFRFPHPDLESILVFQYSESYYRGKVFPTLFDDRGKPIKYLQPAKTRPQLYIPQTAKQKILKTNDPFMISEGEKKALCACYLGMPCIAIGGVWGWQYRNQPIADLDLINWNGRRVTYIPDGDIWNNHNLLLGVYAFERELRKRGADIEIKELPCVKVKK